MEIEFTKNEVYSLNKKHVNNDSLNDLIQIEVEKYQLQYHIMRKKEKPTSHVSLILFICMFLITKTLFAQTDSPKKEEENLNVFQQWIKWNNPGSLAINHLTRQAE